MSGATARQPNSDYADPIPTRASKDRVHSFAETVANQVEYKAGAPLEPIVARLGGKIEYSAHLFGADIPPAIEVDGLHSFVIYLPITTTPQRNRYTIAHELGHYFLHYPMVREGRPDVRMRATRWVDESNEDLKRAEWEANWFAAAFLMPEQAFKSTAARCNNRTRHVADVFDVSLQAAKVRGDTLGLTLV